MAAAVLSRASKAKTDISLDEVFFALADPIRRDIVERLDRGPALVSELAAPYSIRLQSVSQHIQVLVRAGLVRQERSGRTASCSLDPRALALAASWTNRYIRHWDDQMRALRAHLSADKKRARTSRKAKRPRPD
jgi:DNA-binding transcriptional ArsR family regulator